MIMRGIEGKSLIKRAERGHFDLKLRVREKLAFESPQNFSELPRVLCTENNRRTREMRPIALIHHIRSKVQTRLYPEIGSHATVRNCEHIYTLPATCQSTLDCLEIPH